MTLASSTNELNVVCLFVCLFVVVVVVVVVVGASSGLDGYIKLWDMDNGKLLKSIDGGPGMEWNGIIEWNGMNGMQCSNAMLEWRKERSQLSCCCSGCLVAGLLLRLSDACNRKSQREDQHLQCGGGKEDYFPGHQREIHHVRRICE